MRSFFRTYFLLLTVCIFVLQIRSVYAQGGNYRFTHFNINDGLSQNTVTSIFEDSEGYLWFGTQDGLNRYDGYEFKHFRHNPNDSTSISDNYVWGITEDNFGNLWMSTRNGINRYNKKTNSFTHFTYHTSSTTGPVRIIDNEIWYVSYSGELFVIDAAQPFEKSKERALDYLVQTFPQEYGFLVSVFNHSTLGKIIYSHSGLILLSKNQPEYIPYKTENMPIRNQASLIMEGKKGELLVGTEDGIEVLDPATNTLQPFSEVLSNTIINSMTFGPDENLWITSSNGLQILDTRSKNLLEFLPTGTTSEHLLTSAAHTIYKDQKGIMWVGTQNAGLFRYDPNWEQFKFLTTAHGLTSPAVWSVTEMDENEYWVGTDQGVTIIFSGEDSFTSKRFASEAIKSTSSIDQDGIKDHRVSMLYKDKNGNRWVGTNGNGLFILNSKNELLHHHVFKEADIHANQITSVSEFKGDYWVTTFYGIYILQDNYSYKTSFNALDSLTTYFFNSKIDDKNQLWLGSNTGLFSIDDKTLEITAYPYSESGEESPGFYFVNNIIDIGGDAFWLSTFGGGIDLFNSTTNTFQNFGVNEGLANNVVASIELDQENKLWLGTNKGLSRFNPETKTFTNFDDRNGIIFNEMAINASYQNNRGELFFGTADGLVILNPKIIPKSEPVYAPVITNFTINYEYTNYLTSRRSEIIIHPEDKVLSFEFSSLNHRNPDQLAYEFMIEEIDGHWIQTPSTKRTATYSTLPYGKNVFKVRAVNSFGNYSPETELILIVLRPFWLTWWFFLLVFFALLATAYFLVRAYYRYRLKNQLQKLEVAQKVHQERERISRDLHDNVGSQITHIISSLDNITYQSHLAEKDKQALEGLSDFARTTMQFLRETIWVINKKEIALSEFIDRISDYLDKISALEKLEIEVSDKTQGYHILHSFTSMNLVRIIQEGVANAIKHANSTQIQVIFGEENERLRLTISDNGIGFSPEVKEGHYGLRNIESRISELDGSLEILSSEEGTRLELKFPK